MTESNIHKLVSLTFDENPKVRKEAARSLAQIDDPAALFALMELTYDKDSSVKKAAREALGKRQQPEEKEALSFAELFTPKAKPTPEVVVTSTETEAAPAPESADARKRRVLQPIDHLFEKYFGKTKAEAVKGKMMPTIEKIYNRSLTTKPSEAAHTGRTAMQEFLTSYLDAISDIDIITDGSSSMTVAEVAAPQENVGFVEPKTDSRAEPKPQLSHEAHHKYDHKHQSVEESQLRLEDDVKAEEASLHELDLVGSGTKHHDANKTIDEMKALELQEQPEPSDQVEKLPSTYLKRAYEVMMLSGGDDDMMKKEMRRMLKDTERDLRLAFTAAKKKYKETNLAHLTKLKEGMGIVNTDLLEVKSAENLSYTVKKGGDVQFCRIVATDEEGNEGVVYLLDRNGEWLKPGMKIKIIKGQVKSFSQTGETAISVGKKGNIYIVL
jgi:hypothetical protein